jgi:thiol-disulfide isomerase/thioredoxin
MNFLKSFLFFSLLIIIFVNPSPSFSQNKIIPIDSAGVKKLIDDKDCPLLIVASASWCAPCRQELPVLNKMYLKYKDQGIKLYAISLDLASSDMQRIVDKLDIQFPVYWGGDQMALEYNIFGMPTILLIKDGKIQERIVGKHSEKFFDEKISNLIKICTD